MTTVAEVAGTAEKLVEGFMKVEPIVMTVSSFVPGAGPVMALVHPAVVAAAPFIEQALTQLAAGNNGNALSSFLQLLQHLTAGQPNSPILTNVSNMAGAAAGAVATQDPSAQGSG